MIEDTPAPTCNLGKEREQCSFTYGDARCPFTAGHLEPHYIVLRIETKPRARSCADCRYQTANGCEVWPFVAGLQASDCRTYEEAR